MIRKHIQFFGSVQGVGFRYTAYHAAQRFGLTGYVHNEWDGSVTAEVQGSEADIDDWLEDIQSGLYIDIEQMEARELPVDASERRFRIE